MTPNPQQPLENLRPQVIYDALLLHEIDSQNEMADAGERLGNAVGDKKATSTSNQLTSSTSFAATGSESWLSRKIVFSRWSLLP